MYRVGWMFAGALAALAGCWALVYHGQAAAERHLDQGYPSASPRGWAS